MSFDRAVALDRAMLLFWRNGYEGTSLSDLTRAMQVTPPSIYAAFGDKKRLFMEAVERYLAGPRAPERIIAEAASAKEAARALLEAAAAGYTGEDTPPGCLLASSAIACSDDAADVRAALSDLRVGIEAQLRQKIADAASAGEIGPEIDPAALAGLVMAVIQGMSTLARDGASREKLISLAALAIAAWPARPSRPPHRRTRRKAASR